VNGRALFLSSASRNGWSTTTWFASARWPGSSRMMSRERRCFTPKRRDNFWTPLRRG